MFNNLEEPRDLVSEYILYLDVLDILSCPPELYNRTLAYLSEYVSPSTLQHSSKLNIQGLQGEHRFSNAGEAPPEYSSLGIPSVVLLVMRL